MNDHELTERLDDIYDVEATCRTTVAAETWRRSLDDRLLGDPATVEPDGYVWGVRWHNLDPGAKVVPDSATARRWTESVGIEFHEVRIETNAHDLTLVFAELAVTEIPGHTS